MLDKPFDAIGKEDIDLLVRNREKEGRGIDYKEALPGKSPKDKKEFLRDVASFANAAGGHIIFGITDQRDQSGQPTGIPDQAVGLADVNTEQEILRLEHMIRDGTEPRVPACRLKQVDGFPLGPVIILRIPKSWLAPHTTRLDWRSFLYSRTSAGKYALDLGETKSAILASEELPDRIRRFRDERLARIIANEGPLSVGESPKLVLHLVPTEAASTMNRIDPRVISQRAKGVKPLVASDWLSPTTRINFDGVVGYLADEGSRSRHSTYVQVFRSGALEAVETTLQESSEKEKCILISPIEQYVIEGVKQYLNVLKNLECNSPTFVMLCLLGFKGYTMPASRVARRIGGHAIDRVDLLLPEVVAEEHECDVAKLLRPVFDALWNACGFEGSLNYDREGNWAFHR